MHRLTSFPTRREFVQNALVSAAAIAAGGGSISAAPRPSQPWRVGHHFWNWDHAWNKAEYFEQRLRLTRESGYAGFEAKPNEIGWPAAEVRARCARHGVECVAIGAGVREGIDYAAAAGAKILRTAVAKEETKRWVESAAERGIILTVHPHLAARGAPNAVETREDLLRYLDERPGVYACPDTGHLALCGSDPVRTIRDLGERCRYLHLKDIRPERVGKKYADGEKFCELGTGALDLAGVLAALRDIRYNGWIMVERDSRERDYVQSAKNMREVLRKHGC